MAMRVKVEWTFITADECREDHFELKVVRNMRDPPEVYTIASRTGYTIYGRGAQSDTAARKHGYEWTSGAPLRTSRLLNTLLWQGVRCCWPSAHDAAMVVSSSLELPYGQCIMKDDTHYDHEGNIGAPHLPSSYLELQAELEGTWEGMIAVLGNNNVPPAP